MLKKETSVKLNLNLHDAVSDNLTSIEKTFQENILFKDLIAILFDILTILPYEIYNIYYKMNENTSELIIGIGGVNDIRDIGELYLSMKLGDEGDTNKPGACFYRRLDKKNNLIDHTHDIARIRDLFNKNNILDDQYKILFDSYLGNMTIIVNSNLLT